MDYEPYRNKVVAADELVSMIEGFCKGEGVSLDVKDACSYIRDLIYSHMYPPTHPEILEKYEVAKKQAEEIKHLVLENLIKEYELEENTAKALVNSYDLESKIFRNPGFESYPAERWALNILVATNNVDIIAAKIEKIQKRP